MPFDALDTWLTDLERRLDPVAQFEHFLSLELGRAATADPWQRDAILSYVPGGATAMRICRQAGKSCVLATRGVMALERGEVTICLAPAERQTREITRKVATYLRGTTMTVERSTMTEIETNTGGRFIAVPASGATIRGFTADQLLVDECAYLTNDEEVITAVLPMLKDGGQVFYASTPAGKNNFFARLFLDTKPSDALRLLTVRGTQIPRMAAKVERLRTQLSQTKFRQEVECEFIADGQAYFDLSVIEAATSKTEAAIVPKF